MNSIIKDSTLKKGLIFFSRGILLAALLLSACSLPEPAARATVTASPTRPPPATETALPTLTVTPLPPTLTATPAPVAKRVLILSFDGLRADAVMKAPMNNLQALMQT